MGKFKVGDRVRRTGGESFVTKTGSHRAGFIGIVSAIDFDGGDVLVFENGHLGYAAMYEHAPLTIEIGKFYKRRDGAKMGPAVSYADSVASFLLAGPATHEKRLYDVNGRHGAKYIQNIPSFDLIAEWVDEPAVAVAASNDNAAPKFKAGDNIRHKRLGHVGRVVKIIGDKYAEVFWTNEGWGATDPFDDIELVAPQPTAIVAQIENGQPKPSDRPFVHATVESAEKEAERLAGKHRGQRFGVYVLHDTRETDAPAYDHEWQNLAAAGRKIDAIRVLRQASGLHLATAKTAIEDWLSRAA